MDVNLNLNRLETLRLGVIPHNTVDEVFLEITEPSEMSEFFKIIDKPDIQLVPQNYQRLCRTLGISGKDVLKIMPQEKVRSQVKATIEGLQNALSDTEDQEYLATYLLVKRFLLGLNRASVDKSLSTAISDVEHETVKSSLSSLNPVEDGLCRRVDYSMSNTATGRLTVTSGPQILTIPADARKHIKSRYPGGKVLQIDLISAEPKFALHLCGGDVPSDVYQHIASTILEGKVTRKEAKLITLCALYGQSTKNLAKQLPDSVNAREVMQKTKRYFQTDSLMSRLKSEKRRGRIRNAVGRPITVPEGNPYLLVSYYLQSSVAEASILMFSQFVENTDLTCDPLFVIHDALIIDCDKAASESLLSTSKFNLLLGDWKFDAEVKRVGE